MQTTGPEDMDITERAAAKKFHRPIDGIAACLLPFEVDGTKAEGAFRDALVRTAEAGLRSAVNMDTGYANYLTEAERLQVLDWTQDTLGREARFVAGVFVEGQEGNLVDLYRRGADQIVERGGIPILFQTTRFHEEPEEKIIDLYREICEPYEQVLAFELGKMFAPNGLIFSENVIRGLMEIPSLVGMKHSSLCRTLELNRLALRDQFRPDFKIYTGNDLGIDMIEYGSDYLLGLAAFCPEKFAERDRYWAEGDERYFALHDALQYLGNLAFRDPVPSYKHSCALFLEMIGRIPTSEPHPQCPRRDHYEREILADCARRLDYNIRSLISN